MRGREGRPEVEGKQGREEGGGGGGLRFHRLPPAQSTAGCARRRGDSETAQSALPGSTTRIPAPPRRRRDRVIQAPLAEGGAQ